MDKELILAKLNQTVEILKERLIADEGKYVMANDNYIQTEEREGINFTNLLVRCPSCACKVVCYDTEEEARRSADYYLKDGAGRPILLQPMKAQELFSKEIDSAVEIIETITRPTARAQ